MGRGKFEAYHEPKTARTPKRAVTWFVTAVSAVCTLAILGSVVQFSGVSTSSGAVKSASTAVLDRFDRNMTNQISLAMDGVVEIKREYWIDPDALIAPAPRQENFGITEDPASLGWLLDSASDILDGQKLYFSTDTQILKDSAVHYYLDDSILAITWKQGMDGTAYTFSEVKVVHPSQFRRFFAGGEYGSGKLYLTSEMSESVNAVVAGSGDFYGFRPQGCIVYDGKVCKPNGGLEDICYIDENGDMMFTRREAFKNTEEAQQFMDEHKINFSLAFGPVLVQDGVQCEPETYSIGETNEHYARAAICQMDTLHYMLVTANGEGDTRSMPTIHQLAQRLQETGCRHAYTLDGGQTATIVMNNELINAVNYGYQRKISDIVYFATAVPEGG